MTAIKILPGVYGIYKFPDAAAALESTHILQSHSGSFWALSYSPTETSLICTVSAISTPPVAQQESWIGMYFDGKLDFQLVGILSKLTGVLANAGLGVLAVSTFDTDYVFVQSDNFEIANQAIIAGGYTLITTEDQ
jgi:uncharacterized protein